MFTERPSKTGIPQDFHSYSSFLVHYGEIALKKGNRRFFEDKLVSNIHTTLGGKPPCEVRRLPGRIHIRFAEPVDGIRLMNKVSKVFGVASVAAAIHSESSLMAIRESAAKIISNRAFSSFAVRTRRGEKGFPLTSQKVNEEIGAMVVKMTGARVDLENPKFTINIEILDKDAFIFADEVEGLKGLPVGIGGKAACLISGGIDSPVAAWRIMKRGCLPMFIHFHSSPFTSAASQEKVIDITTHLMEGQPKTRLFMVPFGVIQQKIVLGVPEAYRVIIYRRFMVRIAQEIAEREGAMALVTGEALAQVASQTLSNLGTISSVAKMPILRPLIGMDKQEIVDEAKKIGAYEIAIQPHDDCCTFLMPKHPVTKTTVSGVDAVEGKLDIEGLVKLGLESIKVVELNKNI